MPSSKVRNFTARKLLAEMGCKPMSNSRMEIPFAKTSKAAHRFASGVLRHFMAGTRRKACGCCHEIWFDFGASNVNRALNVWEEKGVAGFVSERWLPFFK